MPVSFPHPKAVCGLDVLFGMLGDEPRPGDVRRFNAAEHLTVLKSLHASFGRWVPPFLPDGCHRVVLAMRSEFDAPVLFSGAAVFAHQVVLRDPLDVWLHEHNDEYQRRSLSLEALDLAVEQALA
ncbi:MAG: hypothetical protein ACREV8_01410, partial [Gammaproteobacteria bacterium]